MNAGYHPTRKAEELTLIPKERYRLMDKHFADLGTLGLRMMRASASTQVSIDYTSEADAVRKMRIASALAPVLGAIADNVAVYEREVGAYPLVRLAVWRNVDDDRCGVVPGVFKPGFGFGAYADWLLSTSPIFINAKQPDGTTVEQAESTRSAGEIYKNTAMTKADIEHLISMFWPDVRLKRFVEIRPADSLPQEYLTGYAALIKGLFIVRRVCARSSRSLVFKKILKAKISGRLMSEQWKMRSMRFARVGMQRVSMVKRQRACATGSNSSSILHERRCLKTSDPISKALKHLL